MPPVSVATRCPLRDTLLAHYIVGTRAYFRFYRFARPCPGPEGFSGRPLYVLFTLAHDGADGQRRHCNVRLIPILTTDWSRNLDHRCGQPSNITYCADGHPAIMRQGERARKSDVQKKASGLGTVGDR